MQTLLTILTLAASFSPLWPIDLGHRFLTSNFMEYRDGRFHAGIDLKTNSQTGYPCLAAEPGSISRVRLSAWGYGKVVYLQAESGRTYVYAHLERLADPLHERVRQAQAKTGRYAVDLAFAPGELPVARGEVIALSGQSGTGGPHLHFEVRDAAGRPLDPLACGFAVPDTFAPRIDGLRAVPMDTTASVFGRHAAHTLRPVGPVAPVIRIKGPVAFTADVVERSDIMGHSLAPAQLEVTVDGEVVFAAVNDTITWPTNDQLRLEYLETGDVRERWLHRRAGNRIPGRSGDDWYARLQPGRHDMVVTARDRAGNADRVTVTLHVLAPDDVWTDDQPRGWRPSQLPAPPPADATRQEVAGLGGQVVDLWRREAALPALPPASGLVRAGVALECIAGDWPVAGKVAVALPDSACAVIGDPRVGVYRRVGQGWRFVGPVAGPRPHLAVPKPGLYAVLRDTLPPVIVPPAASIAARSGPARVAAEVTPPRWRPVAIGVGDHGAGVDWDRVRTWLDGRPLVSEPDAPRARLLVELPADLASGRHQLTVEAVDLAGNLSTCELPIVVPEFVP